MILDIGGLRLRSSCDIKSVLMDVFEIGLKDIIFADYRNNGSVHVQVSNQRIEQKILAHNGRRLPNSNATLTVRKVKRSKNNKTRTQHSNTNNAYDYSSHSHSHDHSNRLYSDTLFKINKIPINWDISDVVKYFSVSCNAPLRTCYRLNQDNESVSSSSSSQYVFVEFMSSECAKKARNILERNSNSNYLGIIPIQTKNISKILQYHPTYITPNNRRQSNYKLNKPKAFDNKNGSRAYGSGSSLMLNKNKRRNSNSKSKVKVNYNHNDHCHRNTHNNTHVHSNQDKKDKKQRYFGSSLNGNRLKRQLKRSNTYYNKHNKDKKRYSTHSNTAAHSHTHSKNRESGRENSKTAKKMKKCKDRKVICCNDSDSESSSYSNSDDDSSSNEDSYSCSYSYSSSDGDISIHDHDHTDGMEEGEITKKNKLNHSKKLRHITSKSLSNRNKNKKNNCHKNKVQSKLDKDILHTIKIKQERTNSINNISPKSASIASFTASPPNTITLNNGNGNGNVNNLLQSSDIAADKLLILGASITNASEIKQITKKIHRSSQFMYSHAVMNERDIISVWKNIISFFIANPAHYIIHLDYVCELILTLIKYHCYIIPLSFFLKLPVSFLLELSSGQFSIQIIEAFLDIKYEPFHQEFQTVLIHNIDCIIAHNFGANLIKMAFKKLCKSSLYNIVQIIDKKNYKQLSKELIPIIRHRQQNIANHEIQIKKQRSQSQSQSPSLEEMLMLNKTNSYNTDFAHTNIIVSPAPACMSIPPPPPPRKPPPLEYDGNGNGNNGNNNKRILNGMEYPAKKKIKLSHVPLDPRLHRNMNVNGNRKPIKIVHKKRKNCHKMLYYEWNVNVDGIVKQVEDCIDEVVANKLSLEMLSKNVICMIKSLSESQRFRNGYEFEKYLLPYFEGIKKRENKTFFDMKFYEDIFEIMEIVFKIPESIYTVIEITKNDRNVMHKLRNICKQETILFVNLDNNNCTFCVCSQTLGIVQINNDFTKIFDSLIDKNCNKYENECINHFTSIYNVWKTKGIYNNNNYVNDWINCFIAYLYLVLDICRINYNKITNKYLSKLINVSFESWNYLLPIRVLHFIFENIKKVDEMSKIEKIKPNFYRELPIINGH